MRVRLIIEKIWYWVLYDMYVFFLEHKQRFNKCTKIAMKTMREEVLNLKENDLTTLVVFSITAVCWTYPYTDKCKTIKYQVKEVIIQWIVVERILIIRYFTSRHYGKVDEARRKVFRYIPAKAWYVMNYSLPRNGIHS